MRRPLGHRSQRRNPLLFEPLEPRLLLSADITGMADQLLAGWQGMALWGYELDEQQEKVHLSPVLQGGPNGDGTGPRAFDVGGILDEVAELVRVYFEGDGEAAGDETPSSSELAAHLNELGDWIEVVDRSVGDDPTTAEDETEVRFEVRIVGESLREGRLDLDPEIEAVGLRLEEAPSLEWRGEVELSFEFGLDAESMEFFVDAESFELTGSSEVENTELELPLRFGDSDWHVEGGWVTSESGLTVSFDDAILEDGRITLQELGNSFQEEGVRSEISGSGYLRLPVDTGAGETELIEVRIGEPGGDQPQPDSQDQTKGQDKSSSQVTFSTGLMAALGITAAGGSDSNATGQTEIDMDTPVPTGDLQNTAQDGLGAIDNLTTGATLNSVIDALLADNFDPNVDPSPSGSFTFATLDGVPDVITIGSTLGGGADLQLENVTLTFSMLSFDFTNNRWDGSVGVTADVGVLFPGLLDIGIVDDGLDNPRHVKSATVNGQSSMTNGNYEVVFILAGDHRDLEPDKKIAVLNSNEATFDDFDLSDDARRILIREVAYVESTGETIVRVWYNFDPGTVWTGGSLIALEDADIDDDGDLVGVSGTIQLAPGNPNSILNFNALEAADIGFPRWLKVRVEQLQMEFPDFRVDDSVNMLRLNASIDGFETGNAITNTAIRENPLLTLNVTGNVSGIEFDMDRLAEGSVVGGVVTLPKNPITDISGISGEISGSIFKLGSLQAGFILKEVSVDATGAITTQESAIVKTVLYGAVRGALSFEGTPDEAGVTQGAFSAGFNLAFSELGPLQVFVFSDVDIELESRSGLKISELRGGIRFNSNLEDLQVRPPIGTVANAGMVSPFVDPEDASDMDYRVTITTTGHNLKVGDEFRIVAAGTPAYLSGLENFIVTAVDGDDITYEVEDDPGAFTTADIKKITISDPLDLRDPGFASTKDLSLGDWEAQLDQAVVNQTNAGDSVWDVLFDKAVIEAGATLSFDPRISDSKLRFDADLLFDTEGRFLVTGKLVLGGAIKIPAKLYTDFSEVATGELRFLFLGDLPEVPQNTAGVEPLLVLRAGVTFETLIGGVPATTDELTGLPVGVGMDVTATSVTDLSGTGAGPWDVTYTLDLPNQAPSDFFNVGDSVVLVNNDPGTFDGTYIVRSIDDANDTITVRLGTEVIDGLLDLDLDNDADSDDDGEFGGIPVIDGALDMNRDGTIDASDDGEIFNSVAGAVIGIAVIDGRVDFNDDDDVTANPADDDGVLGDHPGTLTAGGKAANLDDLGDGFRISLDGGIDLNIPFVTTVTLEGNAQLDLTFGTGDAEARIDLEFDMTLSETNVGNIGLADGAFHVTIDADDPVDAGGGVMLPKVEIWGAAILTTDFEFLQPIGLFASAEGLLRINNSDEVKPDEILTDVNNNTIAVALPEESFALRLDGSVDFRIDFDGNGVHAPGESVFQIGGIFVLEFSAAQGFNVALFDIGTDDTIQPANLTLGPQGSPLLELGVLGFLAIRQDGIAADLVLTANASLPENLASIDATAVFILNTTGRAVQFDIPGGATDPNRPTGLSLTIPKAAPKNPGAILTPPSASATGDLGLQALIDGSPTWEEGAAGAYGVVFFDGEMDLLSILEFDISGYVLLTESVVSLEANFFAGGDFLGLASASVDGSVFFSSEGEFEVDLHGDVQLGPNWLNINGSADLTISYLDNNGKASGGTGAKVLDVSGALDVGLTIDIDPFPAVNLTLAALMVGYNSGSGDITVGVTYPEPFWDEACVDLGFLGEACVPFPNVRDATYTFVVGTLKLSPPPPPLLGQVDSSGVLTLNVGSAEARNLRNLLVDEVNEDVTVRALGPMSGGGQAIRISMFGVTQDFSGVTSILIADMADGVDVLEIVSGVSVPTEVHFGSGRDRLNNAASGVVLAFGDGDADRLKGSGASEQLFGGPGNDVIEGGGGQDLISGGADDDTLIVTVRGSSPKQVTVSAQGGGFTASIGSETLSATSVESLNIENAAGRKESDTFTINDLSTSLLRQINLNLGDDSVQDAVVVNGSSSGETFDVSVADVSGASILRVAQRGGAKVDLYDANVTSGDDRITLNSGGGADSINVNSTLAGTFTTVNAGDGLDTINVGSRASEGTNNGNLHGIAGALTINGDSDGSDVLNVDDSGDSSGHSDGRLTATTITGLGMAGGITYGTVESLNIALGTGADTFNVPSTNAGTRTTLKTGTGSAANTVKIGSLAPAAGGNVNAIAGKLIVTGQSSADTVEVDDSGDNAANTGKLTSTRLTGLGMAGDDENKGIEYSSIENLVISLGTGADTFNVRSTNAGTLTTVRTGTGSATNTVNVGSLSPTLGGNVNAIAGKLIVTGQSSGTDTLNVDETGDGGSNVGTLTSTRLTGLGMAANDPNKGLEYTGADALNINLGSGIDTFNVQSTSALTTVRTGTGAAQNTVNVGSSAPGGNGNVNSLDGKLAVIGQSTGFEALNIDETGDAAENVATLTSDRLTGLGMAANDPNKGIEYLSISQLTIGLGSNKDIFTISSTHAGVTHLNSGGGSDTINVRTVSGATTVDGAGGSDIINVGSLAPNGNGTVEGIGALLTVNGNDPASGSDVLNVDDTGALVGKSGTLTATEITGLGMGGSIAYGTIETLNIDLGDFADTFNIASTHAGATNLDSNGGTDTVNVRTIAGATTVDGGGDSDTINVGSLTPDSNGTVEGIGALLTVNGNDPASGSDVLNVDDTGALVGKSGTLTATEITGLGMGGSIAYGTIETLNIDLGDFSDTFNIESTHGAVTNLDSNGGEDTVNVRTISGATTVNGGAGSDTINVGSLAPNGNGTVDGIGALLTINGNDPAAGSDVLNVDDTGALVGKSGTLTATEITGLGMGGSIAYGTIETLNINLGAFEDGFTIESTHTGTTTVQAGGSRDTVDIETIAGHTIVRGQAGDDLIRVNDVVVPSEANGLAATLDLDGQAGDDDYVVNIFGNGGSLINVFDSGPGGDDELTINGTTVRDDFLLRASEKSSAEGGVAFVAALHDALVERVNYDENLEDLVLEAKGGDDHVTLDDNWAETTVRGGAGDDHFQVGQIFKSERDAANANIAGEDEFETTQTTRGFLSNGVSSETDIEGGVGNDTFVVFRNLAELGLFGGDNDDLFIIRSFAEEGSSDSNVSAGDGTDTIEYVMNAAVDVLGGDGTDTMRVIGTEFADKYVVTSAGVFGAGRSISYTEIEILEVEGAEGDDEFYVLSTSAGVETRLFGGLGNDFFSIGGDAAAVVAAGGVLPEEAGSHTAAAIAGPLTIDGYSAEGSAGGLGNPVLLPGETNRLLSTGEVIAYTGSGEGLAVDLMTVETVDLLTVVGDLNELVGRTLEISLGNGINRFWQIVGFEEDAAGQTSLMLKNPAQPAPEWGLPDDASEYAIANLSANFFVDEDTTQDTVAIFNDGSTADATDPNGVGALTATTLTGLGMHPDGITYGNLEVVEVLLGEGDEQFTVESTADGAITAVHGGGGSDTITVNGRGDVDERGLEASLVVFGDTSQDGSRYAGDPSVVAPGEGWSFDNPGRDTIDASNAQRSVVIYGGRDNDMISGGDAGDHLAGGSGDDEIQGGAGVDHIYGDSGFNVDLATRELTVPTASGSSPATSGDDLAAGMDEIHGGDDGDFILGDHGEILQSAGTKRILTTGNVESIRTLETANGAADDIFGDDGNDFILGGNGPDSVQAGAADDTVIGDHGELDFSPAGTLVSAEITVPGAGGADTIFGNDGDDILLGGASGDVIDGNDGRDLIYGDAVVLDRTGAAPSGSPWWGDFEPTQLHHSEADEGSGLNNFGDDYIAGGADDDMIFGQLGNDTIQGDGSIDSLVEDGVAVAASRNPDGSLVVTPSFEAASDGDDYIEGNGGNDVIFGNLGGDDIVGGSSSLFSLNSNDQRPDGEDFLFGGAGVGLDGNDPHGPEPDEDVILGDNGNIHRVLGAGFRSVPNPLTLIETIDTDLGGADLIAGNTDDDIILGGHGGDEIQGNEGNDIVLGDHGRLDFTETGGLLSIETTDPDTGGSDTISTNDGEDIILGGDQGDFISAGGGNDIVLGDHGLLSFSNPLTRIETTNTDVGGSDTIFGDSGDDVLLGGAAGDRIDGDEGRDLIYGDNVILDRTTVLGDFTDPRFRTLTGGQIYDQDHVPQIGPDAQLDPSGSPWWADFDPTQLHHSAADEAAALDNFGDDYIAGGADGDMIFGQLGHDTIQGDGSIDSLVNDGIAVGAVRDQDGHLTLTPSFENDATDGDDYIEGNGGNDVIFGNLGQDDILGGSSNLFSLTTPEQRPDGEDVLYGGAGVRLDRNDLGDLSSSGHARDADVLVGDNANIFRLLDASGNPLTFNYDSYDLGLRIAPRGVDFLDYVQGDNGVGPADIGAADLIHGGPGDDIAYGMTGHDVMFGEGQDDDLYGGDGSDRIYGGAGEDGIVGDNGLIHTSRNGLTEELHGLTTANGPESLAVNGPFVGAEEFIADRLTKSFTTIAWEEGGNDILYGGLGDDFMHGGAGNDAMSGAEALAEFYNDDPQTNLDPLLYNEDTRKLAAYDADDPFSKIEGFLLNFEAYDSAGNVIEDGKDRMFGDLGHDWLVGGTGNDRMFGGMGDDLLNADDNHDTNGGRNDQPDAREVAHADFAFGGGGLDVLIANTGGDRLVDWDGEFNSYFVPFSVFGEPTVIRRISPDWEQFLLDLGRTSGADQSLAEPNGEVGLVTPQDPEWADQQGGPRDPQPGTTKAKRDTAGGPEDDTDAEISEAGSTPGSNTFKGGGGQSVDDSQSAVSGSPDPGPGGSPPVEEEGSGQGPAAEDVAQPSRGLSPETERFLQSLNGGAGNGEAGQAAPRSGLFRAVSTERLIQILSKKSD